MNKFSDLIPEPEAGHTDLTSVMELTQEHDTISRQSSVNGDASSLDVVGYACVIAFVLMLANIAIVTIYRRRCGYTNQKTVPATDDNTKIRFLESG